MGTFWIAHRLYNSYVRVLKSCLQVMTGTCFDFFQVNVSCPGHFQIIGWQIMLRMTWDVTFYPFVFRAGEVVLL